MAAINETNEQYYSGTQILQADAAGSAGQVFTFTFDTELSLGSATSWDPTVNEYALNNFKIYTSATGTPGTWVEYILAYTVTTTPIGPNVNSLITITAALPSNVYVKVELSTTALENNYGGYAYITIDDIVNNFLVGYVGTGKLISNVPRTDVIFHAKRGLQEFSYDVLKSIKCQELIIPDSLSLVIPQDYVNYVKLSWIDDLGVQHIIYPTTLTTNPTEIPIQDEEGIPTQDNFGANVEGDSITEDRWDSANMRRISGNIGLINGGVYNDWWGRNFIGKRYGLEPSLSQTNGWFTINERENKFSFSSNLKGLVITLEYLSDGLAYDTDTKVPKLAEEAMYMHIAYSILASKINQPEYVVQRYKKDRRAALRNAKIRLQGMGKFEELTRIMRNKSKWIKH
jgi:hypothetical protein|tara:strand:+ start:1063 stop:2262 length:1200 start_codon:yes stop_codon:yes gene_type:complete